MLSIRMRASKKVKSQKSNVKDDNLKLETRDATLNEIHISGAEGIFHDKERARIVGEYIKRAMDHPRGTPDRIVITIEKIERTPMMIGTVPVTTLENASVSEAEESVKKVLTASGISAKAVKNALKVVYGDETMRGASLICAGSGRRVEPDKKRGVRATCFGISRAAERSLAAMLAKGGLNNTTVKEALVLASKVASHRSILAELCISDDPHYTTGYVSSRSCGYVRIPRIKKKGQKKGGRVFFIEENTDIRSLIEFMEKTPVMINRISKCKGVRPIDEIINCHNL